MSQLTLMDPRHHRHSNPWRRDGAAERNRIVSQDRARRDDARKGLWPETTAPGAASAPGLRWRPGRPAGQGEQRAGSRFPRTPGTARGTSPVVGRDRALCRDAGTARKLTHLLNRDGSNPFKPLGDASLDESAGRSHGTTGHGKDLFSHTAIVRDSLGGRHRSSGAGHADHHCDGVRRPSVVPPGAAKMSWVFDIGAGILSAITIGLPARSAPVVVPACSDPDLVPADLVDESVIRRNQ